MRLIDVFQKNNQICLWKHDGKKNFFEEKDFKPKIYVLATKQKLEYLKSKIPSQFETHKTLKGKKQVLAIETEIKDFYNIVRSINKICCYECEIFNSDLPLEEYFMFDNDLFPTCNLIETESPFEEYSIPKLKTATIEVRASHPLRKNLDAELLSVKLNKKDYNTNILNFADDFKKEDPDIVITEDNFAIPFLLKEIRKIIPEFSFSRFGKDEFKAGGNSYFSYNTVIYKSNAIYLKGRLHFNVKSLLYGQWNLNYPFELARITRTTLQRANHRSIGYCISNLQLYHAKKNGFLLPRNSSCVEVWKTGTELFNADRGALTLEPVIGYHEDIAEIDFASLYPSIMAKYNISTETLFCRCCKENKVPGLNINICKKERGIIPEMLEPIIQQREYYKTTDLETHKYRAEALKGLLVCSFGYMGFRKSKFARIEAHQAIQAYAREILLWAMKISESHGFEVIHGIVDSLWVKKKGMNEKQLKQLIDEISFSLGLKIKLEGIYRWIVFLPSVSDNEIPVPSRYYGVFLDGELKARGIEIRKHDTPRIIKELQIQMLKQLSKAKSHPEFLESMKAAKEMVEQTLSRINSGNIIEDDVIIRKRISKTDYKSNIGSAVIVKKLIQNGFDPKPGDAVAYIIADKNSSIKENRYFPINTTNFRYDKFEYSKLAKKSYTGLFQPFIKKEQLTLFEAINRNKAEIISEV